MQFFFKRERWQRIACQVSTQYAASIKINARRHEKKKVLNPLLGGFAWETAVATGKMQSIWRKGKGSDFFSQTDKSKLTNDISNKWI